MKTMKKRSLLAAAACLLCLFLALGSGAMVRAADEDTGVSLDGTAEANGVVVTTTMDKDSYKSGDTAVVTVSVENTNSYDLTDVTVKYVIPTNFELTEGERTQTLDSLSAGETQKFSISAVVTKDTRGEKVGFAINVKQIIGIVVAVIVVIIVVVVAVILIKSKKNGKKPPKAGVAAILITAIVTGTVAYHPLSIQAWTEDGLIESWDYSRVSVHDPSIVKDPETGTYYIFGSHLAFAKSSDLYTWNNFSLNISTDYAEVFAEPWAWAQQGKTASLSGQMWAPDVIWNDTMQKWCMYMSVDGDNWCSSICLLTADDIEGPYEYQGIVVYSGMNNPKTDADISMTDFYDVVDEDEDLTRYASTSYSCINAIDPCVKYDDDGNLWMTYGSWSAGIFALKLDNETGLRDYSMTYESERDVSDAYYGIKLAGGYYSSGEASYIIHTNGYYYMFLSYASLQAVGGYQMRIYRSENLTGPYVDENGESAIFKEYVKTEGSNYGVKIFGSYLMDGLSTVQVAQGHNSAYVDDDGKIYLVYHTRFQSNDGTNELHQVRVHQLFVNEDDWLIAAPYEYAGETLPEEGYSTEDVCGEYDFIYHEPTLYYNVLGDVQVGIVGNEKATTREVEVSKEMVISNYKSVISCTVSFSHDGGAKVCINEDGTISGDYTGTWEFSEGANVIMNLDGVTYKGVFLQQQDESLDKNMRMTFSVLGDNVTVWGVQTDAQIGIEE